MAVNKLRLRVNQIKDGVYDRQIIFPFGQTYDEAGRGDLVKKYEDDTIDKLVGIKKDYEVVRYTHAPLLNGDPSPNIFYNFNLGAMIDSNLSTFTTLFPSEPNLSLSPGPPFGWDTNNDPCPDNLPNYYPDNSTNTIYLPYDPNDITSWYGYDFQGFTPEETYKSKTTFTKSFFKLDLYNSRDRKQQKLFISIIINPINGIKILRPTLSVQYPSEIPDGRYNCRPEGEQFCPTPNFELDPINNNEGYFIYWLKEKTFLDIDVFYMSCKFYNGKTGEVTQLINTPQSDISKPYSISKEDFYYYRVVLNQNRYTYTIYSVSDGIRVGEDSTNPIKFYQYFNAP
jgi:hypothetical protein